MGKDEKFGGVEGGYEAQAMPQRFLAAQQNLICISVVYLWPGQRQRQTSDRARNKGHREGRAERHGAGTNTAQPSPAQLCQQCQWHLDSVLPVVDSEVKM